MELISRRNLPSFVQQLTLEKASQSKDVRLSLYLPNCRSHPNRMAAQAKRMLEQSRSMLSKVLKPAEVDRRLECLEKRIHEELGNHFAEGFAFFFDDEHLESHRLTMKCEALVVVANSFHLLPLLRSLSHEPHYRLVVLRNTGALIARMDHAGTKEEVKMVFPLSQEPFKKLHQRPTEKNLSEIWTHTDDCARSLMALQSSDPRPLAIFGDHKLRKRLMEYIRPSLNRPIFCQGGAPDSNLEALAKIANEAFELRVADESPIDLENILKMAKTENRLLRDLPSISKAAAEGLIETLIIGENQPLWGHRSIDGELILHSEQKDSLDDCVIDDSSEDVIKRGGSVFFAPLSHSGTTPNKFAALAILSKPISGHLLN